MFLGILFLIVSTGLTIIGAIMCRSVRLDLVGGYDKEVIKNKKGLSVWFGKCFISLGGISLVSALSILLTHGNVTVIIVTVLIFMIMTRLGLSVVFLGVEKYK